MSQNTSQMHVADLKSGRFLGKTTESRRIRHNSMCNRKDYSAFFDNHANWNMWHRAYNGCTMASHISRMRTRSYRERGSFSLSVGADWHAMEQVWRQALLKYAPLSFKCRSLSYIAVPKFLYNFPWQVVVDMSCMPPLLPSKSISLSVLSPESLW